jgi:hypothetical protein
MKTIAIHLHNGEQLLLVGVPYPDKKYIIRDGWLCYQFDNSDKWQLYTQVQGEILGSWIPRTDSIDFEVQEDWIITTSFALGKGYYDYRSGTYVLKSTKEQSFLSLLTSEASKAFPLKENEFGDAPKEIVAICEDERRMNIIGRELFDESQSKVMPEKFVVLKIEKQ